MIIFKVIQLLVILLFGLFISDLRKKEGMMPIVSKKLVLIMKLCYPIPILIYIYTILTLRIVLIFDIVAIFLTVLGSAVVIKSKIDLGKHHTWTGYCFEKTKLIKKGIYLYIRHPLYTGIFVFILGAIITIIIHAYWFLTLTVLVFLGYIMTFLFHVASLETKILCDECASEYTDYKRQVHPFLPISKYRMIDTITEK